MTWHRGINALCACAFALAVPSAGELAAQGAQMGSLFSRDRDNKQPINIESDSLELRDKEKTATFINNVKLVQGDMMVECKVLVVHYEDPPGTTASTGQKTRSAPKPQSSRDQQIRLLEASGGVVVTQKDQVATGDKGIFDMRANTAVITGNVVLTQGQNVVRGDRLFVDLNTNLSRVEAKKSGDGRVQGLFLPREGNNEKKETTPAPPSRPGARAPADTTRNAKPPSQPMRLN